MTTSIASMFNLAWPDLIPLLLILLMLGGIPILVIVLVMRAVRKSPTSRPPPVPTTNDRLQQLDVLRQHGQITDTEHADQRRRILEQI